MPVPVVGDSHPEVEPYNKTVGQALDTVLTLRDLLRVFHFNADQVQVRIADIFKRVRCEGLCPERDSFSWSRQLSAIDENEARGVAADKIAEAQKIKSPRATDACAKARCRRERCWYRVRAPDHSHRAACGGVAQRVMRRVLQANHARACL
jgi:hypothetical protein